MHLALALALLPVAVPMPLSAALAASMRLEAAAGVLADALDADLRRAEAALLAAATALDGQTTPARGVAGAAVIPFLSLDRLVRGVASTLDLPVVAFDARLAPLVDSAMPFGVPLPASPAAHLAAEALDAMRAVGGTVEVPGSGLHAALAVPISGPADQPLGALVALLPPDHLSAALEEATEGMDGLAAARLEAQPDGEVEETGAAPLVLARHGEEPRDAAAPAATRTLRHHPSLSIRAFGLPAPPPSDTNAQPPAPLPEPAGNALWLPIATGLLGLLGGAVVARRGGSRTEPPRHDPGEQEARQALAELRAICDTIPVGLALLDADRGVLSANRRMAAFAGLPEDALPGRLAAAVLPPVLAEAIEAAHLQVMRSGRAVLDVPVAVEAPGSLRHTRHLLVSCHPVRDASRRVEAVSASVQDVTERTRAEAGRNLLVRELNHRVKNCLATVQTIAQQTLRNAGGDMGDFARSFGERIRALARAHDLLTVHAWGDAELQSVARAALSPWLDDRRLLIEAGPEVMLRPAQAQALVLAFNELATNASKYGALTREDGKVRLRWGVEVDGTVQLSWLESGGPPVEAPTRRGFGSRLLEQALGHDLGSDAETELNFAPSGLRAAVRFRAGGVVPQRAAA